MEAWKVLLDTNLRTKEDNNGLIKEMHKHFVKSFVGIRMKNVFSLSFKSMYWGACVYIFLILYESLHCFDVACIPPIQASLAP